MLTDIFACQNYEEIICIQCIKIKDVVKHTIIHKIYPTYLGKEKSSLKFNSATDEKHGSNPAIPGLLVSDTFDLPIKTRSQSLMTEA